MMANRNYFLRQKLLHAAVASCFAISPAFANPNGASVVSGQVGFSAVGNTLTVTNSPNAIINWQQFSIQPGEVTRFVQVNAQSAVLNRVVGQDPSQILGSLLSNGRVFLINPNGIVFGQGSVIDVAGLVASTLKLSDEDFLAGRLRFTDGVGAGSINNQGSITTPTGGKVYLIAPDIRNSGIISTPQGEILLAAGHSVNLMDAANPDVQVTLSAPDTQAVNLGTLMARSGKIGVYGALISQQGTIDANTAIAGENGQILLKASREVTLDGSSMLSVRGGGSIKVLADMDHGQVHVDGTLDASAPVSGNGGFIETSAAHVTIADTAHVTTRAAQGRNGTWLIDPADFTIAAAGGDMTGAALSAALGGGNVTILSDSGASGVNGDIFVNDWVSWAANTTLTLTAQRNIDIHRDMTATGAGSGLTLNAGGMVTVQPNAANLSAIVNIGGNINVNAAGLAVRGGTASAGDDVTSSADAILRAGNNVTLTLGSGGVTVRGGSATASASSTAAVATAMARIEAGNSITINTTGSINVNGGTALANAAGSFVSAYADASATIEAARDTAIRAAGVNVQGGTAAATGSTGGAASAYAESCIGGDVSLHITSDQALRIDAGSASASGSGLASATAQMWASPNTIYLTFPMLSCCGFYVNGVAGQISSGGSGFFINYPSAASLPAVLNSTLFVTYMAIPASVMNFTINEINGSSLPPWVFEGIRYGDWSKDDGKTECR